MDNNEKLHRASIVYNFLEEENILHLNWHSNFPDGNPFQHVLNSLGTVIAQHNTSPGPASS